MCFDWGGVIVRIRRTWQEAVREHFLHDARLAQAVLDAFEQRHEDYVQLHAELETGMMLPDEYIRQLCAYVDGMIDEQQMRALHDSVLVVEYPGMAGLVQTIVQHPFLRTALLSNSNPMHYARHLPSEGKAADFPTIGLLQYHIISHEVGAMKPSGTIYRAVESATLCRGPEILFFDDLPKNVEAARALGWHAEQINHDGDPALQIGQHLAAYGVRI